MPKYAALIYTDGAQQGQATPEQMGEMMAEYGKFHEAVNAAGVFAGGEALEATTTATTIRVRGGEDGDVMTTDGPFAETKEVLGGFYLLECADLDDALKWASQIPGARYGALEVRPVFEYRAAAAEGN